MVDYAATKSVVVNLENDSLISEDPFFLVRVIQKVNSWKRTRRDAGFTWTWAEW